VFAERQGNVFADGHGAEKSAALKRHANLLRISSIADDEIAAMSWPLSKSDRKWAFPGRRGCATECSCPSQNAKNYQRFTAIDVEADAGRISRSP